MGSDEMDYAQEKLLGDCVARSLATRDAVALLLAYVAAETSNPTDLVKRVSAALNDRLDELPTGQTDLKEKVRAEQDWLVGAAQAFLKLGQP